MGREMGWGGWWGAASTALLAGRLTPAPPTCPSLQLRIMSASPLPPSAPDVLAAALTSPPCTPPGGAVLGTTQVAVTGVGMPVDYFNTPQPTPAGPDLSENPFKSGVVGGRRLAAVGAAVMGVAAAALLV